MDFAGGHPSRGVVIVAAGQGTRMGADKVWLPLAGIPVVAHSLRAFASCRDLSRMVLVVSADRLEDGRELVRTLGLVAEVCAGGERRQDSVQRGLDAVGDVELVAVHDGARPLASPGLIEACYEAAAAFGAAVPAVQVRDTIKQVSASGWVEGTVQRSSLWAAQTPQAFRTDLLRRAYAAVEGDVTDEAAAVEAFAHRVRIVPGDADNVKLTTPEDLAIVAALLARREAGESSE